MLIYTFKKGSDAEVNIKTTFGVHVEKSSGLIGKPSFKPVDSFDWKYLHGTTPDLRNRRYQNKEITLNCWMAADSKQQLTERFNNFINFFAYDELLLMKVMWNNRDGRPPMIPDPHAPKGIFSLVWLCDVDDVRFKWRYGEQIIRFTLKFIDPYPVRRVYRYGGVDIDGVDYSIISDTEMDIFVNNGISVYDILTGSGHIDCPNDSIILVCGDVSHATSEYPRRERTDPEVPVDPTDPTTFTITGYDFIRATSHLDTVTTIYEEI